MTPECRAIMAEPEPPLKGELPAHPRWIQLEFPFLALRPLSRAELARRIDPAPRRHLRLRITRNRVTMASATFLRENRVVLSLHEGYLDAPDEVIGALRSYLRTGRSRYWETVSAYALAIPDRPDRSAPVPLTPRGEVHDLAALFEEVNQGFFGGSLTCRITWGRRRDLVTRHGARSIRFGSYLRSCDLIRIHPFLDRPEVPADFLRYVIFHEALHSVVPVETRHGRILHHSPTFQALERSFPGLEAMRLLGLRILDRYARHTRRPPAMWTRARKAARTGLAALAGRRAEAAGELSPATV